MGYVECAGNVAYAGDANYTSFMGYRYGSIVSERLTEAIDIGRCWWSLARGTRLPLNNQTCYLLLYPGRPGGPAGPDVRDAVFLAPGLNADGSERRLVGDVEFHLRAGDWYQHRHHLDRRYNRVILHVVLVCDQPERPGLRQDGEVLPVCSLYDLGALSRETASYTWPCQYERHHPAESSMRYLLRQAGELRFEAKRDHFVEQLHQMSLIEARFQDGFQYDRCFIPALAESLGYGRERALFRDLGNHLVGLYDRGSGVLIEEAEALPGLDRHRLKVLFRFVDRWRVRGVWKTFHRALEISESGKVEPCLEPLRRLLEEVGSARADICICNVILPFAAAIAIVEHDMILFETARTLYLEHPGLPSNQITRAMSRQLGFLVEPESACCQQGLHYIYQQTCREKLCGQCIVGKRMV